MSAKGASSIATNERRMRNVKRVLERYHAGELSVYDVARTLKISLLHAERLVGQTQPVSQSSAKRSEAQDGNK